MIVDFGFLNWEKKRRFRNHSSTIENLFIFAEAKPVLSPERLRLWGWEIETQRRGERGGYRGEEEWTSKVRTTFRAAL
jgi:hypothetical protein